MSEESDEESEEEELEESDEELDELDAKEAAQFKADVQGHRHHEVSFVILFGPMRCSVFTFYSIPL